MKSIKSSFPQNPLKPHLKFHKRLNFRFKEPKNNKAKPYSFHPHLKSSPTKVKVSALGIVSFTFIHLNELNALEEITAKYKKKTKQINKSIHEKNQR